MSSSSSLAKRRCRTDIQDYGLSPFLFDRRKSAKESNSSFQRCRLSFDANINIVDDYHAWIPLPASVFSQNGKLYVVLMTQRVNPNTLNIEPLTCYRFWLQDVRWYVILAEDNVVLPGCSPIQGPLQSGDSDGWTIVLECNLGGIRSIESVSLAVGDSYLSHNLWQHLQVCNFKERAEIELAACTLVSKDYVSLLPEWIAYHQQMGFSKFLIYANEPITYPFEQVLRVFDDGLVRIIPFYFNAPARLRGLFAQKAQMTDCLYRLKGYAKWVALTDVDEYIHIHDDQRHRTLPDLLDGLFSLNPWLGGVVLRSWFFGFKSPLSNCSIGDSFSRVSSMTWRMTRPYWEGREKVIARVDNVHYVSVHHVTGGGWTWEMDAFRDGRLVHYRWPVLMPAFRREQNAKKLLRDSSVASSPAGSFYSED